MAQEQTHTPGPWTVKRGEGRYGDRLFVESHVYSTPTVVSGKDQIVQLSSFHDDHGREVEANASLIAAAPEMLASLKEIIRFVDSTGSEHINRVPFVAARAAIAKASGAAS